MRKLAILGVAALALLLPTASNAQVSVGLRLGYAPAMGDAEKDSKMSDGLKSQIPIQLDVTYKLTKEIAVGGYASYGFGQLGGEVKDTCDNATGVSCSASVVRLGVQGTYAFAPMSGFLPWAGAGIGYEWGTYTIKGGGEEFKVGASGFEFLNLQVGGDYQVSPQLAVGPFLGVSFAQYGKVTFDDGLTTETQTIQDKGMHEFVQFGIRGKFDL